MKISVILPFGYAPMLNQLKKTVIKPKKSSRKILTPRSYLAALSLDQRAALQKLRAHIKTAAPNLKECIRYGIPAFCLNGTFLVGYAAATNHCSFYPGSALKKLKVDLTKKYSVSKGTIRFSPDKPLPKLLVHQLMKIRLRQRQT